MSGVTVARITADDIAKLREIRMEALTKHPEAFSADPDRWAAFTEQQWRDMVASRAWFAARDGERWLGIAAFGREGHSKKTDHIGSLGAMYVRPEARGKGVGDALIGAALEEAAKHVEQLILTVNAENKSAIALYERHGFRVYGKVPRALCVDGRYFDELEMARAVSASD
jgi:ribosomal protein S18 acetylase RimI-like enzyme